LNVAAVYEFQNAEPVERAIHQRFQNLRKRGEWFSLGEHEVSLFNNICSLLGGEVSEEDPTVNECEIEQAEEIQEAITDNNGEWDYAAMFSSGWRIETKERGKHWQWRERRRNGKSIYGGRVSSLPYPVDELRRLYDVGETVELVKE
jgi:hypothetical protein